LLLLQFAPRVIMFTNVCAFMTVAILILLSGLGSFAVVLVFVRASRATARAAMLRRLQAQAEVAVRFRHAFFLLM
jgi:hypothetical protein